VTDGLGAENHAVRRLGPRARFLPCGCVRSVENRQRDARSGAIGGLPSYALSSAKAGVENLTPTLSRALELGGPRIASTRFAPERHR